MLIERDYISGFVLIWGPSSIMPSFSSSFLPSFSPAFPPSFSPSFPPSFSHWRDTLFVQPLEWRGSGWWGTCYKWHHGSRNSLARHTLRATAYGWRGSGNSLAGHTLRRTLYDWRRSGNGLAGRILRRTLCGQCRTGNGLAERTLQPSECVPRAWRIGRAFCTSFILAAFQ